ncbi:hypothetical protein QJS10_CPA02g01399 [Acorus calamus]|uniref:Uncharacterized protein n=1 Tax=Acorus calamus TaxID=4465 RepID=A0AAV9FIH2_ACOCL|nr:hypothetical protein QJS10_CPA02g01399 [Acorus calamus]
MGNRICGKRRSVVDERFTRPRRLEHQPSNVDYRRLRKLILSEKLAPCFDASDDPVLGDLEECPICFLEEQKVIEAKIRMQFQDTSHNFEQTIPATPNQPLSEARSPTPPLGDLLNGDNVEDMRHTQVAIIGDRSQVAGSSISDSPGGRQLRLDIDLEEIMLMEAIWQSFQKCKTGSPLTQTATHDNADDQPNQIGSSTASENSVDSNMPESGLIRATSEDHETEVESEDRCLTSCSSPVDDSWRSLSAHFEEENQELETGSVSNRNAAAEESNGYYCSSSVHSISDDYSASSVYTDDGAGLSSPDSFGRAHAAIDSARVM